MNSNNPIQFLKRKRLKNEGHKENQILITHFNYIRDPFENERYILKKNGAARLDPWEIFLLLALKIPFHFISLRKLENYLQFYMTIVFKLNRTKKKFNINLNSPSI